MDPNTRLDQISFAPTDAFKDVLAGMTRYSSKIALIVDSNCRLIGIVTDGDIRRALALGIELTDTIEKVMNRKPITASPKESRRALMGVMRRTDLTYIPVVDEDRRVIRVESLAHLTLSLSHHDGRRALLMAGGFGTRLRPLTDSVPKPLIKLGSKPIIEVIIDDLRSAGFSEIMISTHYRAEMIESHLGDGGDLGVEIAYIREDIPLGTAGALRLLPSGSRNRD
jgi:CBS domain-containing protein